MWQAAAGLPVEEVQVATLAEIDEDCWFNGALATVRAVIDHARRIEAADLTLPIILAADGQVLDGMRRIAKAVLEGHATVLARRLPVDPAPDWFLPQGNSA